MRLQALRVTGGLGLGSLFVYSLHVIRYGVTRYLLDIQFNLKTNDVLSFYCIRKEYLSNMQYLAQSL